MKVAIIFSATLLTIILIGTSKADENIKKMESMTTPMPTTVVETTMAADESLDITFQDICSVFCRVVLKKDGTWRYRGICRRAPKKFISTCRDCRKRVCAKGGLSF